jgi:arsenate reductase
MNLDVRALLRGDRTPYEDLNLDSPHWSDEQLLDFIGQYPIRTNRTIVPSPQGTRLCRPSEVVLDLLQSSPLGAFSKEDGEVIVDAEGRRAVR